MLSLLGWIFVVPLIALADFIVSVSQRISVWTHVVPFWMKVVVLFPIIYFTLWFTIWLGDM